MKRKPRDLSRWQLVTIRPVSHQPTKPHERKCTQCGTPVAHTEDWTLWPWPDGAELCSSCNDARHEVDDFCELENQQREKSKRR